MSWNNGYTIVEIVREVGEHEARIWRGELDAGRQRIDDLGLLHPGLHVHSETQKGCILSQHVDREDQGFGRPRVPVAPLHTGSDVNCDYGEVITVLVPRADPGDHVVRVDIGVVEIERLVEKVETRAIRLTGLVGMKTVVVLELAGADPEIDAVGDERARPGDALLPLAAGALYPFFGILLDPMLAAAAMSMSSVFVVTNSLRIRRFRPPSRVA